MAFHVGLIRLQPQVYGWSGPEEATLQMPTKSYNILNPMLHKPNPKFGQRTRNHRRALDCFKSRSADAAWFIVGKALAVEDALLAGDSVDEATIMKASS
eukprot:6094111-Amphidinium_carterae.1